MRERLQELEKETEESGFWDDPQRAAEVFANLKRLRSVYEPWSELRAEFADFHGLYTMALDESEKSLEEEIVSSLEGFENRFSRLEMLSIMVDDYDEASCFLTIHSGAGGTEACDWVSMLLRMYTRWAERHGFETEILSLLEAEGGIKSVTTQINGEYTFGHLKAETGVHRLVRISPFDASRRRHTSFASVFASPIIEDDIEVEIKPDEIRLDTYRATGAGGQHVNKTDSAVRITHLPTGIVVQCQNERSQFQNKTVAMKVLRSRLYEHYREERERERDKVEKEKKEISWGNQIRSYTFQPYTLVKDHRTNHEIGNIQAVMDGDIDPFIGVYLRKESIGSKKWLSATS